MLLFIIIFNMVLFFVVYRYKRRRMYELASMINGPKEMPFIGIAHKFIGNTEDIMSTLQELSYMAINNEGLTGGWLGHTLYYLTVHPPDVEVILKTCLEKDDLHRFIRKVTGYGGIFAPVSIWRRRRKIMVPAFSPKIVEKFVDVFAEQADKLTNLLSSHEGTGSFSAWPFLCRYTLDSVGETAMGVKMNAQGNPKTPYLIALGKLLNIICKRIFHLWLQPDWLFRMFPDFTQHQKSIKIIHGFTDEVIRKKRLQLKNEHNNKTEADQQHDMDCYSRQTFLDILISLSGGEKGYNDIELREEVLTLIIAATDTSAVCIGFTLLLLAKYPEVQEKVYQELYDIYGNSDRLLVKEDLLKLRYLERVIKESLRLYPPVPFVIRKVLEETTLPSGHILSAGSGAVISIWGIHRNPDYWGHDAEMFDPDRFLPERFNLANTCNYMPFSSGPRNCVGYQYAFMSMKTVLATILRRYRVIGEAETSFTPHIRVKLDIMMKAVNEYQIALEQRKPVKLTT